MRTDCKCHGPSGTCTIRTCWRKMPSFREVGKRLSKKFGESLKMVPSNDGRSFLVQNQEKKKAARKSLVYADESPNFCYYDRRTGSLGTYGRECNVTSDLNGCNYLCCSRGYETKKFTTVVNCGCKLNNYRVKCEQCEEHHTIQTCR